MQYVFVALGVVPCYPRVLLPSARAAGSCIIATVFNPRGVGPFSFSTRILSSIPRTRVPNQCRNTQGLLFSACFAGSLLGNSFFAASGRKRKWPTSIMRGQCAARPHREPVGSHLSESAITSFVAGSGGMESVWNTRPAGGQRHGMSWIYSFPCSGRSKSLS